MSFQNAVNERSLFNLALNDGLHLPPNIDLIDFRNINGTYYMRLRNYQDVSVKIKSEFVINPQLMLKLVDENLYIHCLERKNEESVK
jgi:hypothetical protein